MQRRCVPLVEAAVRFLTEKRLCILYGKADLRPVRKSRDTDATAGIVMGSDSDWKVMRDVATALDEFGIVYEVDVVSTHRMSKDMVEYGRKANGEGPRAIIAGARGVVYLLGMLIALASLPVVSISVPLRYLDGTDLLLSVAQMPAGVLVTTVSITGARDAELLVAHIIDNTLMDWDVRDRMAAFQDGLRETTKVKGVALCGKLGG